MAEFDKVGAVGWFAETNVEVKLIEVLRAFKTADNLLVDNKNWGVRPSFEDRMLIVTNEAGSPEGVINNPVIYSFVINNNKWPTQAEIVKYFYESGISKEH